MSIAFISDNLTYRGGNIKQIIELANYFSSKKNKVVLFCTSYDAKKCFPEIKKNFEIKQLPESPFNHLFSIFANRITKINKMKTLIQHDKENYDYFYIHDAPYYMLSSFLKKEFISSKVIWHMNDLPFVFDILFKQGVSLKTKIICQFLRMVDSHFIKKFNHVTTLSNTNRENIKLFFNISSEVVNSGTDIYFSQEKKNHQISKKKKINVLTVGAFYSNRRYEDAIAAIAILNRKRKYNFSLKIVGYENSAPEYATFLHNLVKKLNISDDVHFIGSVTNEELKSFYSEADIFVQSTDHIGWTIPATEAMLSSIPTIITNTCGLNECVVNYKHALVIKAKIPTIIADKIEELIKNNELYLSLSKNGRQLILDNYTWEKYCLKIETYIRGIK